MLPKFHVINNWLPLIDLHCRISCPRKSRLLKVSIAYYSYHCIQHNIYDYVVKKIYIYLLCDTV